MDFVYKGIIEEKNFKFFCIMKYYVSGIFVLGKTILIYWATAVHGGLTNLLLMKR